MKFIKSYLVLLLALAGLAFTAHAFAADPSPAVLDAAVLVPPTASAPLAPVALPSPVAAGDLLTSLGLPSWIVTALSIFGTVSIAYQALAAFAHKRAAETADVADDQWLASLEAKTWFKLLDRIFYWGGYLGAKLGGKKL